MRNPYAAKVLHAQVGELRPDAEIERYGEPDGLGVYRTFRYDKDTAEWLAPLLRELSDPRITDVNVTDAGYLHVTFASNRLGDIKTPFALEDAEVVMGSADAEVPEEQTER